MPFDYLMTITEVYDTWIGVGGNTGDLAVYMTAIAMAESGGDPGAVSSSDDHGLWQINGVHAAEFPKLWPLRYQPGPNARMARAISNNGLDIGPWCTAWYDPRNCGHYLSPPPELGSPAGKWVAGVAAAVGDKSVTVGKEQFPPGFGAVHTPGERGWGHWERIVGPAGLTWHQRQLAAIERARRI